MKKNESRTILFLGIVLLGSGLLQAQKSVITCGGSASGTGGTVAYSVGQVVCTTIIGASGIVSQGVQQAYEIFTLGISDIDLNISLSVFPNPTTNNLTLQVNDFEFSTLSFQLFDLQGKLLISDKVVTRQTLIDTTSLPAAIYFVKVVSQDNKNSKIFKIIKN